MSKLLIDQRPLIVLPRFAVAVGLNEAIICQQIHYWLVVFKESRKFDHHRDGAWWVWNTIEGWQSNFPFWSLPTIKRTLASLREPYTRKDDKDRKVTREAILLTGRYNKMKIDRTLWYTLDYDEVNRIEAEALLDQWCGDDVS